MNTKPLSSIKGYLPFMLIIFLNSFVDVNHKILVADTLYKSIEDPNTLTSLLAILNALILLPYILFFTPTGFIADRFPKVKVIRVTAAIAVPLTLGITVCYYLGQFWPAYIGTLLLGIQSAFNSPAKYGYIKELFGKNQLAQANAIVQPLIIIAICFGTIIPTILFQILIGDMMNDAANPGEILTMIAPLGWVLVILSSLETFLAYKLPEFSAVDPDTKFSIKDYLKAKYTKDFISNSYRNPSIFGSIIGLAIFMAVSQVLLATYPAYLKEHIPDVGVVFSQLPVAMASIGILIGSWYAGKISRGFIETGIIPIASALFCWGIYLVPSLESKTIIIASFIILGMFCGALIVPLNAIIQFNAKKQDLGKVMATNNLIQNVFMLGSLVCTGVLPMVGISLETIFSLMFIITLAASIFAVFHLPLSLIRYLIYFLCSAFFRVDARGINNLPGSGGALLLGNHLSYLDWAIIQIASPRPIRFVMEKTIYEKWYLKIFLRFLGIIPIKRTASKDALDLVHQALINGEMVALFPEGYLSRNGQLGEFLKGFEKVVAGTGAIIIPFYHRGLWGSALSHATKHYQAISKMKSRHVSISFGKPMPETSTAQEVKKAVQALSITTWSEYIKTLPSIPTLWLSRAKKMGNDCATADSTGLSLSHHELISAVMLMAKKFKAIAPASEQQNIGILMPPSVGGTIVNLACWMNGQTVVNLNYTASKESFLHAIKAAKVKTIVSSEAFLKKLESKGMQIPQNKANIVLLEHIKSKKDTFRLARNLFLVKVLPTFILSTLTIKYRPLEDTAAILFSSGSEGVPKGVQLSHANLIANTKQASSVFNMEDTDTILSALPLFHAFGLSVTMLMPLLEGLMFICHPDPRDVVRLGKLISDYQITLLCGTSTLFKLYCKAPKLHPLMLDTIRFVVGGAEKLDPKVRQAFKEKFNLDIYEGYGTTEVSPVASANLPDYLNTNDWHVHVGQKLGTVGLPLPGTAFKIVDPTSYDELPIGESGMILIGGPQVMKGYLSNPQKTKQVLIKEKNVTWYVSGDKGYVDQDGFLTIVDRYSRFAKVAGEMVSLTQLEHQIRDIISTIDKDGHFSVSAAAIPSEKTGEGIGIIFTGDIDSKTLLSTLRDSDIPRLYLPSEVLQVDQIPTLGSGKIDSNKAKQILLDFIHTRTH